MKLIIVQYINKERYLRVNLMLIMSLRKLCFPDPKNKVFLFLFLFLIARDEKDSIYLVPTKVHL